VRSNIGFKSRAACSIESVLLMMRALLRVVESGEIRVQLSAIHVATIEKQALLGDAVVKGWIDLRLIQ
jgi:hypothetical protein